MGPRRRRAASGQAEAARPDLRQVLNQKQRRPATSGRPRGREAPFQDYDLRADPRPCGRPPRQRPRSGVEGRGPPPAPPSPEPYARPPGRPPRSPEPFVLESEPSLSPSPTSPTSPERRRRSRSPRDSWEARVNAFMAKLGPDPTGGVDSHPRALEAAEPPEDPPATPLVRFVGQRLSRTKAGAVVELHLSGVFQYNLLSLLSRSEWVAARTMELLAQAGYPESAIYRLATLQGGPALAGELKQAVFRSQVRLESSKPEIMAQVLRVIDWVVDYFTAQEDETDGADAEDEASPAQANRRQSGLGSILQRLKQTQPAVAPVPPAPQQAPENPWTHMSDHIQAQSLRSFAEMKTFLAKSLLRLGDANLCRPGRGAFEVAQDMVACLVLIGYHVESLKHLVVQTPVEDIMPPRDCLNVEKGRKYLHDVILSRLRAMQAELPRLSELQLEFLVRKALTFVMRGCDKLPMVKGPAECHIVFNYLPPGLREAENQIHPAGAVPTHPPETDSRRLIEEGSVQAPLGPIQPEDQESTDPLNAILNPAGNQAIKPNELPSRKYLIAYVHLEWIAVQGRPQIYEISVHLSDLSSMTLYTMTQPLMNASETLDILGFVRNPDRQEVYFVQQGLGCTKALRLDKAFEKVAKFLEEKRNVSSGENQNNGIVFVTYSEEELAILHRVLEETGHKNLFIDIIKGLGCVEHFVDRNKSKKYHYGGPKFNVSGDDSFYHTEVKRGIQSTTLICKSKGESLAQSLEYFLGGGTNFKNFLQPTCCPALSPKMGELRRKLTQMEDLYHLEVFMAAHLKNQRTPLFLEGIFQPHLGKDFRDKPSVVASCFCRMLVQAGFDKGTLSNCFTKHADFTINSSVFLDKMNMTQRLKVMDQTMRCIRLVKDYFQPPTQDQ